MRLLSVLPFMLVACNFSGEVDADIRCTGSCDEEQGQCYDDCEEECANPGDDEDQACDEDCRSICDEDHQTCTGGCTSK